MVCSVAFALTGCKLGFVEVGPTEPADKFEEAYKNIGDEIRVGALSEKFKIDDLNWCDVTAEVEMPSLLQGEKISVDVKGGFDKDAKDVSLDLSAKYKSSDIPLKAEVIGGEKVYLSFPGVVNDYLYYDISKLESNGDYTEAVDSLKNATLQMDELKDKLEALIDKYSGNDRVKVETADVEVLGNTVSGAEKLSVTLERDDIIAFMKDLVEIYKEIGLDTDTLEFDEDEIEGEGSVNVVLYVKDGKTVKADFAIKGDDFNSSAVYEMAASSDKTEAKLNITVEQDGKTVASIPFTYEHTVSGENIEGKASVDLSSISNEDTSLAVGTLNVEFSGKESANSSEMNYVFKVGGGGMTIEIPLFLKVVKTSAESLEVECVIDAQSFGVKLSVKGRLAKDSITLSTYDPANAIDLTDSENEENGEKIEALLGALTPRVSDFVALVTSLLGSFGGGLDF